MWKRVDDAKKPERFPPPADLEDYAYLIAGCVANSGDLLRAAHREFCELHGANARLGQAADGSAGN